MLPQSDRLGLLGRDRELRQVRSVYDDARSGRGAMVFVTGHDGIGKSRFIAECARFAEPSHVLRADCTAGDDGERFFTALNDLTRLDTGPSHSSQRSSIALVDDIHLGTDTFQLHLARQLRLLRNKSLLLIVSASERVGKGQSMPAIGIEDWQEFAAQSLRLPPLSPEIIEILVRATSKRPLPSDTLDQAVALSDGNPRYAIEIAEAVGADKCLDLPVPEAARRNLEGARRALTSEQFELIRICAVLGSSFRAEWVARISGRPFDKVADALQVACDLRLLEERGQSGRFSFVEQALCEAAYTSLISPKRLLLHKKATDLLRDDKHDSPLDLMLARQFDALGDPTALHYFLRSARELCAVGDFSSALKLYDGATKYIDRQAPASVAVQLEVLHCIRSAGRYEQMIPNIESIWPIAVQCGDEKLQTELLEQLFCAHLNNNDRPRARSVIADIAAISPENALLAETLKLVVCAAHCWAGEHDQAAAILSRIQPDGICDARFRWRFAFSSLAVDATRRPLNDLSQRISSLVELASPVSAPAVNHSYLIGASIGLRDGDLGAVNICLTGARSALAQLPEEESFVLKREIVKCQAQMLLIRGDLAGAREAISTQLGWRDSGKYNESLLSGIAVAIGIRIGDEAFVDAFFKPALLREAIASGELELCGFLFSGYADAMEQRSMHSALVECLRECLKLRRFDPYFFVLRSAARYACQGDLAEIDAVLAQREGSWSFPVGSTHVALARAIVSLRRGNDCDSIRYARQAAKGYNSIGWRLCEAYARELAGQRHAARRLYEECGASADVERLRGYRVRKSRFATFGSLITPREYEIGCLVARGLSDPQVASMLRISPRTVNHHVGALLTKLGIASRTSITPNVLDEHVSQAM